MTRIAIRTRSLISTRIGRGVAIMSSLIATVALTTSPSNAGPAYTEVTAFPEGGWTVPAGVTSIDILCVGGGGAGGAFPNSKPGGGGGGGEVTVNISVSVTPGSSIVTYVGDGGLGNGLNGETTTVKIGATTLCKARGGNGGQAGQTLNRNGAAGGSGGAGGASGSDDAGGLQGGDSGTLTPGGGGGGAGHAGDTVVYAGGIGGAAYSKIGNGGAGTAPSTVANPGLFADYVTVLGGGGGGGGVDSVTAGAAGSGGGGAGGGDTLGVSGTPNKGGGGGGSGKQTENAGRGGSGLVIIRYATSGGGGNAQTSSSEPPMVPVPGSNPTVVQSVDTYTCMTNEWGAQLAYLKLAIVLDNNTASPLVEKVVYDNSLPQFNEGLITVNAATKSKYSISTNYRPTDSRQHTLNCIVTARGPHSVGTNQTSVDVVPAYLPGTPQDLKTVTTTVYFKIGDDRLQSVGTRALDKLLGGIKGAPVACRIDGWVSPYWDGPSVMQSAEVQYSLGLNRAVMTMAYLYSLGLSTRVTVSTSGPRMSGMWHTARRADVSCTYDANKAAPKFNLPGPIVGIAQLSYTAIIVMLQEIAEQYLPGLFLFQTAWTPPSSWVSAPETSISNKSQIDVIPDKVFASDYNVLRVMAGMPGLRRP